jgi:hypothetical protein
LPVAGEAVGEAGDVVRCGHAVGSFPLWRFLAVL